MKLMQVKPQDPYLAESFLVPAYCLPWIWRGSADRALGSSPGTVGGYESLASLHLPTSSVKTLSW